MALDNPSNRCLEWPPGRMLLKTVAIDMHGKCVFGPHNPLRESLAIDFKNGLVLKILRLTCTVRRTRVPRGCRAARDRR